jgi:fumarate hydratase class II
LSSLATHRDALAHDLTLKEAPLQLAAVSAAEFDRIVDPRKMVKQYVAVTINP